MRVVVETVEEKSPPSKPNALDSSLQQQFVQIQRQLMGFVKAQANQDDLHDDLLAALKLQQNSLVAALERLMKTVHDRPPQSEPESEAMVTALQELRQVMTSLPDHLQSALKSQSSKSTNPAKVTVQMSSALLSRIDSLEQAMVEGLKRSRNRTFGSNY